MKQLKITYENDQFLGEVIDMSDVKRKREELKGLLRKAQERAEADGKPATGRVYWGRTISVNAGRYDDRLDEEIAKLREHLAEKPV